MYLYFAWLSDRDAEGTRAYLKAAEESGAELAIGVFLSDGERDRAKEWLKQKLEELGDKK